MTDTTTTITIDMDKDCAECGKRGAMPSELCISCVTNLIHKGKKPKSWQGRAMKKRWDVRYTK